MSKQFFILANDAVRQRAVDGVISAPEGYAVEIKPANRSLDQNAKLWQMLHDLSVQVDWHGNKLSEDEWKDVLTAALKQQKVVPGLEGGFVVLGQRTSKMNKKDFSELLELTYAFGAQQGVMWSEQSREAA